MSMKYHDFPQGSQDWHQHRAQHWNASDAPAMMGCSPYMTRTELLTRMKTGISAEVDAATQRRFDDGHRFEALARPLAEKIIGQELYPVTGTRGKLSASFDGLTLDDGTAFEHKSLNDDLRRAFDDIDTINPQYRDEAGGKVLPMQYRIQMEQQLLVSGAKRVLFMASKWNGDELVEECHCWYFPDLELRAQIVAGWEQFERDLAEFAPTAKAAPVIAAPVETLPAVSVKVDGALAIVSNLPDFGAALRAFIEKIPVQPSTDQEFADTEAACKALKKAEDALDAAESNALAQLTDVDTMRRLVADFKALARTTRLQREKLVAARKDAMKAEIVASGMSALAQHIRELNAAMPADYMPQVPADFGGCIKGLKSVDSIRNAVDTELANAKIRAIEIANRIHANVKTLQESGLVVHDAPALVLKQPDDLAAVIAQRKAAEQARLDAERERIRAEEAARLEREAEAARKVREAAEEMARKREQDEADRVERERAHAAQVEAARIAREQAEAASAARIRDELIDKQMRQLDQAEDSAIVSIPKDAVDQLPFITASDDGERITLGQINERLAPIALTADGLATLGFPHVATDKSAKLYRERDFPRICAALVRHIQTVQAGQPAPTTQAAP